MEATRALLYSKNLPEKLWGEAANAVVHVLNRTINKNTACKTPYELYFGVKPNLSHIKVFGCLALVKAQEKKRSGYQKKLEPRASKGILVGYERAFTYRIFEPKSHKIVITRDVIFDENKTLELRKSKLYKTYESCINSLPVQVVMEEEELDVDSGKETFNENIDVDDNDNGDVADESFHTTQDDNEYDDQAYCEALVVYGDEPRTYSEAVNSHDSYKWFLSMKEEYNSLVKNNTWDLVSLPKGRKAVSSKWVFKIKRRTDGTVERFKSRLVARGYTQKAGIDFHETFSPVARLDSIRLILSTAAKEDLELFHFDVATAFLNGILEEEIYMTQPEGFEKNKKLVCRLNKSIYGLKQASRAWNTCFTSFLKLFNLKPLKKDNCVFIKKDGNSMLILALYVDDGLLCSNNQRLLKQTISYLKSRFEIKVMDAKCFVGLQIVRNRRKRELFIYQQFYIEKAINRFNLKNCKLYSTPADNGRVLCKGGTVDGKEGKVVEMPYREAIGCLIYISNGTRPDISYIVNKLASYCASPRLVH